MQREIGNRRGQILPLLNLGVLHYEMGKPQQALDCYEESIAISRAVGESNWARALTWNNIGEVYIVLNEPVRAIEVVEPVYRLSPANKKSSAQLRPLSRWGAQQDMRATWRPHRPILTKLSACFAIWGASAQRHACCILVLASPSASRTPQHVAVI